MKPRTGLRTRARRAGVWLVYIALPRLLDRLSASRWHGAAVFGLMCLLVAVAVLVALEDAR